MGRSKCQDDSRGGEWRGMSGGERSQGGGGEDDLSQGGNAKDDMSQGAGAEDDRSKGGGREDGRRQNKDECKTIKVAEQDDSLTVVVKKQEAALKKLEEKHGSGYGKPPPGSKSEARAKKYNENCT